MSFTHPPKNNIFNGISIILNRPSRFDKKNGRLFSGNAGEWFRNELAKVGINLDECHITTASCNNIPKETKTLFLLGDLALSLYKDEVSVGEQRGSPFTITLEEGKIVPVIVSFTPQDAFDPKNYEALLNPDESTIEDDSDEDDDKDTGKAHGKTKRKNYRYWLSKDIRKLARIHSLGLKTYKPNIVIYPSQEEVIHELLTNKGKLFHIDIETSPETGDITVFSFMFEDMSNTSDEALEQLPIYCVPVWRYNYTLAYDNIYRIFASLSVALRDNTAVHHNGSGYDLFIFPFKYRIPFGNNNYDTMLSHHRCCPEVEKSLGHCVSLYTDQPFHKNDGVFVPHNTKQEMSLWVYNATDVFTTALVKHGIDRYAKKIGAEESIKQVNANIAPNLTMTFKGILTDIEGIKERIEENGRRVNQLLRVLQMLVGRPINPNSTKDMPHYLYSKKDKGGLGLTAPSLTKSGKPAANAEAIIKLYVSHPKIISLMIVIEIRRIIKENSALNFTPIPW